MKDNLFMSDFHEGMRSSTEKRDKPKHRDATPDRHHDHPSRKTQRYHEEREEVAQTRRKRKKKVRSTTREALPSRKKVDRYRQERSHIESRYRKRRSEVHTETRQDLASHERSPKRERPKAGESVKVREYREVISDLIARYLPNSVIDTSFALAVIAQESKFDHGATSHKGVKGLCQITGQTIRHIVDTNQDIVRNHPERKGLFISSELVGRKGRIDTTKARTPINQIKLMLSYLAHIEEMFDHIKNPDFKKDVMMTAYNLGPGATRAILRNRSIDTSQELKSAIASSRKIKPAKKRETLNYIAKVNGYMDSFA